MSESSTGRTCGGCTACCKTHAVTEVDTTYGVWCQHCTIGKGCGIYEQRPEGCRLYECVWLKGRGEDADRPDRLGIVMDLTVVRLGGREIIVLNLWEVDAGAAAQKRVRQITEANLAVGNVVRHRLSVPLAESPFRVLDKIFYPPKMADAERDRLREALRSS